MTSLGRRLCGACLVAGVAVLPGGVPARGEPAVSAVSPQTVPPAATATFDLLGKEVGGDLRGIVLETAAALRVDTAKRGDTATATIDLPAGAAGPLSIVPVTAAGPGTPQIIVIDDLPVVSDDGAGGGRETALGLTPPVSVDGTTSAGQADCFRFRVAAGQRIAVEVISRQIGSPLDPVVRLLDAAGRPLVTSDDGPAGPECRFAHTFAAAGECLLELRHSAHAAAARYHLRIGDFPLVSHAMPLAVRPGGMTRVTWGGADGEAATPIDVAVAADTADRGLTVAARLPGGRSAAWVRLLVHDAPQVVEREAPAPLPIPVGVSGRLARPGERDTYRLAARKDERLLVTSRARSLGCGTVPRILVRDAAGKLVAETPVSEADEPELAVTFPADGEYTLEIDDLARRGGADAGYFLAVERPPGFAAAVKPDAKTRDAFAVEPGTGCAPVDLVVKRSGYDGEIAVSFAGAAPGLRILDPIVPAKATEARIVIAADEGWTASSLARVRLVARPVAAPAATAPSAALPVPVTTSGLRRARTPAVAFPAASADGAVVLAGVAAGPARVAVAPAAPVQLVRTTGTHAIHLGVQRLDPQFTGPVTVAAAAVPAGFTVSGRVEKDACLLALTGSAARGAEPTSLRLRVFTDAAGRTTCAEIDLPLAWVDGPPAAPAAATATQAAPAFAAGYAAAIATLSPRAADSLAGPPGGFAVQGAVRFDGAAFASFAGGRLAGAGPPLGDRWTAALWCRNGLPVDRRPVTAYLFSRGPDGAAAAGDHLGIGGTHRPGMAGKLFVFNGNAADGIALGRTPLAPGGWHHVVLVRDGGRVRVHLDGREPPEIDADLAATAAGAGNFFLGGRSDGFAPLDGSIAHVAVFDRPLSVAEAATLFTAAMPRPAAGSAEAAPAAAAEAAGPEAAPTDAAAADTLDVYPPAIVLDGARDRQQVAVSSTDAAGFTRDWTRQATIRIANPAIAAVRDGRIVALSDGATVAEIEVGGRRRGVPVTVRDAAVARPVRFENDLLVALSKQSCSSGACHGSPSGKGGFRLSLRAFDPKLDEFTVLREEFGRRVDPLDPDASLLLAKPLMRVPHGGGRQLAAGDDAHEVIRAWIAAGAPPDPPGTPRCVRLEVSPAGRRRQRLGEGGLQIVATAHDADGRRRDVTRLAAFESSAPAVATVDAHGRVTPARRGETVILVRYLEHIELVPLLFVEEAAGFAWQPPPENNRIDTLVNAKLRELGYPPSRTCSDAEFVRRVHLDVIGLLPTGEETRAFLADASADKRARLVDRLLDRDEHARSWALKWGDLLRMTRKLAGDDGVHKYHRWLEESFRANKPHDVFARELLLGTGSTFENPPAAFYRTTADMNETVETVAQLFLGVRLQCAKCHNHPFDRWSQDDYYGLGAFFDRVRKRNTQLPGESFVFVAQAGETTQPRTGKTVQPWLPRVGVVDIPAGADRREAFVDWLLAPGNPFFARVEANRIWSQLFARGIVHPVDEFRDSNPAANPPLLDWLAAEFAAGGFDRRRLVRTILASRTYQASSTATAENAADTLYGSHQSPRLLTAEQLLDAICQVTGVEQPFANLPAGTKATQLPAPDVAGLDFLTTFGQPARGTVCACERAEESSLGMAIELVNGRLVQGKLADPNNRFRRALAAGRAVEEVIVELYLAALSRPPSTEELAAAVGQVARAKDPSSGVEDVCWALLNADEFVFQH